MEIFRNIPKRLSAGSRIKYVDGARIDSYSPDGSLAFPFKTIQAAIDSISDASPTKKYRIHIAPGTYTENVVCQRHVALVGVGDFGPAGVVKITSSSGHTVAVGQHDCLLNGFYLETTSSTPTDSALYHHDDGGGAGADSTFCLNMNLVATDAARAVFSDNPGEALILIYAGVTSGPSSLEAVYSEGGGFVWFLGGGSDAGETCIKLRSGGFAMLGASVGINASPTSPTAWAIDADASAVVILDAQISAYNGIKLTNGSFAMLHNVVNFGGMSGTPLDVDVTCFVGLGNVALDAPFSAPWGAWNVLGTAFVLPNGQQGFGTTGVGGPDQRPTGVPLSWRFFAADLAPGGGPGPGSWLTWSPGGWVDSTGAIIP